MNPENPDPKKISDCDWVFVDGIGLRAGRLEEALSKVSCLLGRHANIMVLSASGVNEMTAEQAQKILRRNSNGDVEIKQDVVLKASDRDLSYLPLPNEQRQIRLTRLELVSI